MNFNGGRLLCSPLSARKNVPLRAKGSSFPGPERPKTDVQGGGSPGPLQPRADEAESRSHGRRSTSGEHVAQTMAEAALDT